MSESNARSGDPRYGRSELDTEASLAAVNGVLTSEQVGLARTAGRRFASMIRNHGKVRNRYQP